MLKESKISKKERKKERKKKKKKMKKKVPIAFDMAIEHDTKVKDTIPLDRKSFCGGNPR